MREIRPIDELGSRIQEAGRIRLGIKGPKGAPKAIDTFRFTSVHRDLIEQLATLYGGTARPWSDAKAGAKDQFEVITTAKSIRVFVPPGGLSQDYELWSGARCERRCDGVTAEVPSRGPDGVQSVPCVCHANQKLECKPVTRLTVVLPELPFRGVWRMETKSWNAADELNAMEKMIDSLQETRDIVAAELHIEQRSRMTAQGKRNFVVPVLTLSSTLEALAAGDTGLRALASYDAHLELTAGDIEGSRPTSVSSQALIPCPWCSRPFPPSTGPGRPRTYCSDTCRQVHGNARREGITTTIAALGERDGWICDICNGRINPLSEDPDTRPSIEHRIPVSRGGTHDESNLAIAHRTCNVKRNDGTREIEIPIIDETPWEEPDPGAYLRPEEDDVAEAEIVYEADEIQAEAERLANDHLLDPVKFRTGVCLGASDGVKVDESLLDDDEKAKAMAFLDAVARADIEVTGIDPKTHRLQIKRR